MTEPFKLPAMHYLPRTFDEPWIKKTMGNELSRPSYLSVAGEPVVFCLCGRIRDLALSADDGGPLEDVFVEVAPLHPADGTALITLIRRVGYYDRGESLFCTVVLPLLILDLM